METQPQQQQPQKVKVGEAAVAVVVRPPVENPRQAVQTSLDRRG